MTDDQTHRADTADTDVLKNGEMTEQQLGIVAGGVLSPRDPASGLPTGQRMHKPYVITKL